MRLLPPPFRAGGIPLFRGVTIDPSVGPVGRCPEPKNSRRPAAGSCFPGVAGTGMAPGPSRGPGGTHARNFARHGRCSA